MISVEETQGRVAFRVHAEGHQMGILYLSRISPWGDGPWIANLWVHPEHRRRGVAAALLAAAERFFPGQTLRGFAVSSERGVPREALEAFCLRVGFRVRARERGAALMEKAVPGG